MGHAVEDRCFTVSRVHMDVRHNERGLEPGGRVTLHGTCVAVRGSPSLPIRIGAAAHPVQFAYDDLRRDRSCLRAQ